ITSPVRHRPTASGSRRAPAASYSASEACALSPAPRSTDTSKRFATRRLTVSGVIATRRSCGVVSLGTAILIMYDSWLGMRGLAASPHDAETGGDDVRLIGPVRSGRRGGAIGEIERLVTAAVRQRAHQV